MEQPEEAQFQKPNELSQEEVVLPGSLTVRQREELRELIRKIRSDE